MAKNIDFSQPLGDVQAPSAPSGAPLASAAELSGKAAAGLATFLGTAATEVTKGLMQRSEEGEINEVLRKLDTNADRDIANNTKKVAATFLESFHSEDYAGQQTIQAFNEEAARYAEARRQGVIGRDEAVAQIGAIVKKYSAMVPGFASDFRKVGAELTGISNIDVYGIHKDLTTQSTREKLELKKAEDDLQLRKEAASALGLTSIDQLTRDAESFYRTVKQTSLSIQQMESVKKAGDMQQEARDKVNTQLANSYIGQTVAGVVSEFAQLHAAHMNANTPDRHAAAMKFGGEVAAKLDVAESQLIAKIKGMSYGQNAMDGEKNRKLVEEVQSIFKTYKQVVQTSEGFNLWTQTIKAAKGNAEYVVNAFKATHPHATVLAEFGVMSKFAEAMVALGGDQKAFEARFGKPAAAAANAVLNYGPGYANTLGAVAAGRANLDQVGAVDPQMARVAYNDIVQIIDDQARNGGVLRNEQKLSLSNLVHQWLGKMNHTDAANLKKFQEIAGNPEGKFWTQVVQLNPEQRKHALLPLFDKVVYTTPNVIKDLKEQVEKYNSLDINKTAGHKAEIKYDPITNSFKLDLQRGTGVSARSDLPKGAIGADISRTQSLLAGGFDRLSTAGDPAQREALGVINQRISWLNTIPDVMAKALPMANDSFNGIKPQELGQQLWSSYQSGQGGIGKALVERMNKDLVPGNTAPAAAPGTMRTERAVGEHVSSTAAGEAPVTPAEAKEIHTRNIGEIEMVLKTIKDAGRRAILQKELDQERAALVSLSQ